MPRKKTGLNAAQGVTYQALLLGDPIDVVPGLKGYESDGYKNAKGDEGSLYNTIYGRSFVALVEDDSAKLKGLGTVLSRLAMAHLATYEPGYPNKLTHDASGALGLAYDMLARDMSEEERRPVRRLLSRMTRFRQTDGTPTEPQENSSNWKTFHDHIILASLAIEGEEGYDPRLFEDNIVKLRNFFTRYGVFPSGCAHEGWGISTSASGMRVSRPSLRPAGMRIFLRRRALGRPSTWRSAIWQSGREVCVAMATSPVVLCSN